MMSTLSMLACLMITAGIPVKGVDAVPAPARVSLQLEGPMGRYAANVVEQWLLPARLSNPGMLEMMRLRDRKPDYEDPVPWAGEFAGKYLTSAVLMRHLVKDARLDDLVRTTVADLIAIQADDGYLGPFKKKDRLLGNWDLWGHYHCMLGLYLWYKDSGDEAAKTAALRAADLICDTYLDTGRRIYDAGSAEMNMAVIHIMGLLYRETGNERYLRLMHDIEEDWRKPPSGDYLYQAKPGVEFWQSPKPRWESLHPMLGLAELFRITGEPRYRDAMTHWWKSIRQYDVHNSGSFSTNEQATGNPFMTGAIETCCTVAWIAYSIDTWRLTADPAIADTLELAAWNAVPGYTHPSGRWCTYDTPMNGKRLASAHSIVFQSRPGTPELNCCSVNGPRGFAMLGDWAIAGNEKGIYVNYYGPGEMNLTMENGDTWKIRQAGDFPKGDSLRLILYPGNTAKIPLHLRIPGWSKNTMVSVNNTPVAGVAAGSYLTLERDWKAGDWIDITFDMTVRALRSDTHMDFKTALYRGPLLLTYDQKYNDIEAADLPALDLHTMQLTPAEKPALFPPIALFQTLAADGTPVYLCDFAGAGAHGTYYQSWLPVDNAPPAPFYLDSTFSGKALHPEDLSFAWSAVGPEKHTYHLKITSDPEGKEILWESDTEALDLVPKGLSLKQGTYYWTVTTESGQTPENGPIPIQVDPNQPLRHHGVVMQAPLKGDAAPMEGALKSADDIAPAAGRHEEEKGALYFNGKSSRLVYEAPGFPLTSYTFAAWICPENLNDSDKRFREIACAWYANSADPLRIAIVGRELIGRIEGNGGCQISGGAVENGVWIHVALVKDRTALRLFINGEERKSTAVPASLTADPLLIGIGSNPLYEHPESFEGRISDAIFLREARDADALKELAGIK